MNIIAHACQSKQVRLNSSIRKKINRNRYALINFLLISLKDSLIWNQSTQNLCLRLYPLETYTINFFAIERQFLAINYLETKCYENLHDFICNREYLLKAVSAKHRSQRSILH